MPLFAQFYKKSKTNFHRLVSYAPEDNIADEIVKIWDEICQTTQKAKPRTEA